MSEAWGTAGVAAALPVTETSGGWGAAPAEPTAPAAPTKTPQEHGWVQKKGYDYVAFNKTNKEIADEKEAHAVAKGEEGAVTAPDAPATEDQGAVGGIAIGEWAGNAAVYEWKEEFGDVGPEFPQLEKQLFGSEFHVKAGINFQGITELDVTQEGPIRLEPIRKFEDAGLHPVMLRNVQLAGYDVPTPIQQYCLPAVFKGHDITACAQTGSGKTAAFLIPILSKLMGKAKKLAAPRPNPALFQPGISNMVKAEPLVLIVCPSRELATQIFDEARRFCYRTMLRPCVVYGGGPLVEQLNQIGKGCDVLIGTPGRLVDFINRPHCLTLRRLHYMVIDEADEMLQSDWETELKQIMSGGDQEEGNIKYMMFSATFPKIARELAKQHLAHDHVRIRVGRAGSSHKNIQQDVIFVDREKKLGALFDLLMSLPPARTIIFVNSKRAADEVDDYLFNLHIPCTSIHSDRTQREREDSIRAFRIGKAPVLIATGVSARGLDIHNVAHVINFDLPSPQLGGIEEYTHRIGRTGRIGNRGLATSFYNDRDADLAPVLVKTLLETAQPVPDFLSEHVPENYEAGKTELDFDDKSDDGNGEEGAAANGGGAWGADDGAAAAPAAGGWGAEESTETAPVAPKAAAQGGGWAPSGNDA
ncbi:P-loop containing nucleoside triphosphate hydrolase protein [Halenospora varia]|nr:P-loop containing nucleoside triphosphate hydrolase protein [Halenospora varia]